MDDEGIDEAQVKAPFLTGWMIVAMVGIVAIAAVSIAAIAVTQGSGGRTARTTTKATSIPATKPSPASVTSTSALPQSVPTTIPSTGATVDISDTTGDEVAVTLDQVVDPDTPDAGSRGECSPDHLVAVQLTITNLGSTIMSTAAIDSGVILVDSQSAPWQNHTVFGCGIASSTDATSTCASSSNALDLAPGATGIACPAINVPSGVTIAQVQFQAGLVFPPAFSRGLNAASWQTG